MKRAFRRPAADIIGMDLHLVLILGETDRDETRLNGLVHRASDRARKVGFGLTLERDLPGDYVFVFTLLLASIDHVAASDRAIRFDYTS